MPERVLIIDDEVVLAGLYVRLLAEEGYKAFLATTPDEAIPLVQEHEPALILLDCKMPLFSGEEFVGILRERCPAPFSKAFVVGFSSFDPDMNVVESFKESVHQFVRKPDDVEAFISLIADLMNQSRKFSATGCAK